MNKIRLAFFLSLALWDLEVYSQSGFKKLDGEWLVSEIINLKDSSLTRGKHTDANGYLKFKFKKRSLEITTSPIDIGIVQSFTLSKTGEITLFFSFSCNVPLNAPEVTYKIKYLNENLLKLQTTDIYKNQIEYVFNRLSNKIETPNKIEIEPILIKKMIRKGTKENILFSYNFKKKTHQYQHPVYKKGGSIGADLSMVTEYPESFELGKVSEELIISISLNTKGKVKHFKKIQGINSVIDESVINFLSKTKWKSIRKEKENIESELVFHFQFLLEEGNLF